VPLAAFDHQQLAGLQRATPALDDRHARPRDDVQPLIRTAVVVVRVALAVAGRDDHFGGLCLAHRKGDPKALAET
jgi:hypothetical protein